MNKLNIFVDSRLKYEMIFKPYMFVSVGFKLDFWTEPSLYRATDIRVSPRDFGKLRAALAQAGMSVRVQHENLQQ